MTHKNKNPFPLFVIGALGVVFGDIGTSPLYTLQSCFFGHHLLELTPATIIGVTSTVIWAIVMVVTVKYVVVVLRADHRGEGGILALTTLSDSPDNSPRGKFLLAFIGILGAALLYSDGVITPAISVLSAVEGLKAVTPRLTTYVVPVSLAVLCILFLIQSKGTGRISALFGPVMVLWFLVLGGLGLSGIIRNPFILTALNPLASLTFLVTHKSAAFFLLGSVFLAVTGAEVLYADIGHFGKRPIRLAWLAFAFPMLVVNYLGQSAMLLNGMPAGGTSVFYNLCPPALLIPMIILSTAATIIASQAVISGMFSLARQAMHLDYWPRVRQIHTSAFAAGQVYVPIVNFLLFAGTVALVLFFKKSENLASAYGIAVSTTMVITTILLITMSWKRWKHGRWIAAGLALVFLPVDLGFLASNATKIASGGYVVVLISVCLYIVMSTWRRGRRILQKRIQSQALDTHLFVSSVRNDKPTRVSGIAVFLTGNKSGTPRSLLHNFKHNRIIHETVILVTIVFEEIPYMDADKRYLFEDLGEGILKVDLHYGFFESPDVPASLEAIPFPGFQFKPLQVSYYLGRESLVITKLPTMKPWRKRIFRFLSMNALDASEYFELPPTRVVEVGLQVEM